MLQMLTVSFVTADPKHWGLAKLVLALGSIVVADLLFYDQAVGFSLALFLAMLGMVTVIANPVRADSQMRRWAWLLLAASLMPILECCGILSVGFGLMGIAGFAVTMTSTRDLAVGSRIRRVLQLPFLGFPWLIGDCLRAGRLVRLLSASVINPSAALIWIVPILIFAAFLWLFREANPLIDNAIAGITLRPLFQLLNIGRLSFWVLILGAIWPLLHLHAVSTRTEPQNSGDPLVLPHTGEDIFLGARSVIRTLVLCNALFAIQSGLDGVYLWGGLSLPHGMTYASYAHRGAYPLIVTALLAGAFVLIATREGGPAATSKLIRPLVMIWTAQTIGLVVSAILRLQLYIEAFSLTRLRVIALIWMMLVLIGLILIIAKIIRGKSLKWLIGANGISLTLTLYAACFVNFPYVEARYNIDHCLEVTGSGPKLDVYYIYALGSDALPALDHLPEALLETNDGLQDLNQKLRRNEAEMQSREDWRSWSFRQWRLDRYLSDNSKIVF